MERKKVLTKEQKAVLMILIYAVAAVFYYAILFAFILPLKVARQVSKNHRRSSFISLLHKTRALKKRHV